MGVRSIGSGAGGGKGKGGGAPKDGYDAKSYYRLAGEDRDEGEGSDGEEVGLRFVLLLFELFSVKICTDVAMYSWTNACGERRYVLSVSKTPGASNSALQQAAFNSTTAVATLLVALQSALRLS